MVQQLLVVFGVVLVFLELLHQPLLSLLALLQRVPVLDVLPHIGLGFEELDRRRAVLVPTLKVYEKNARALFRSEVRMGIGVPHQLGMHVKRLPTPLHRTSVGFNSRMDLLVEYQGTRGGKVLSALVAPTVN